MEYQMLMSPGQAYRAADAAVFATDNAVEVFSRAAPKSLCRSIHFKASLLRLHLTLPDCYVMRVQPGTGDQWCQAVPLVEHHWALVGAYHD
jgi:hypothetical protein